MYAVGNGRERVGKYFWWFAFFIVIGLISAVLGSQPVIAAYRIAPLDVAAMYGLVCLVGMVGALWLALLLARLETLAIRRQSLPLQKLPRAIIFVCFVAMWSSLFLRILVVNGVTRPFVDSLEYYRVGVAAVGIGLFLRFPLQLGRWVDQMVQPLRIVGIVSIIAGVGFTGYLFAEPFGRHANPSITRSVPETPMPHVVIIVLDTLTSRDMSVYGYHLPTTPNLDQLSKTWTVFENAHAGATGTIAVQPTILTGRYPILEDWPRYGDLARQAEGVLSLPSILRSFGYTTVYGMGGGWSPSTYHFHSGFDRILGGGFSEVASPHSVVHRFPGRDWLNLTVWNPVLIVDGLVSGYGALSGSTKSYSEPMYDTAAQVLQSHATSQTPKPFFMYLHMNRPHPPFLGDEFLGRLLPVDAGLTTLGEQVPLLRHPNSGEQQADIDRLRLRYNENILKADQQVGSLIKRMQQLGVYDQSVIIITSDHGISFAAGNQGYYTERLTASEHNVPLLVKFPGQIEGRRVDAAVSLVDILPTVLDVVGVTYPRDWIDGQSLEPTKLDPERTVFVNGIDFSVTYDMQADTVAAINGPIKLLQRGGQHYLYDLKNDQDEHVNLAREKPAECLRQQLGAFLARRDVTTTSKTFPSEPLPSSVCSAGDPTANVKSASK